MAKGLKYKNREWAIKVLAIMLGILMHLNKWSKAQDMFDILLHYKTK